MKVFSTTAYRIYIVHSHWPKAWNNTSPCLPRVAEILTVLQRLPVPCGVWVEGTQRHRAAALVQDGHWQVTPAETEIKESVLCVTVLKYQNWSKNNEGLWVICSTILCPCVCRKQCVPRSASVHDEHRTVKCRYETMTFVIALSHTVFFLENKTETLCTSGSDQPLDLSQHCEFTRHLSVTITVMIILETF